MSVCSICQYDKCDLREMLFRTFVFILYENGGPNSHEVHATKFY